MIAKLAWCVAGAMACSGARAADAASFAIQPQGEFHAGEPIARDGEDWLALRVANDEAALIPTRARVGTIHDALVDEAGDDTGREVASSVPDAVVLLQGFAAGAVPLARLDGDAGFDTATSWGEFSARGLRFAGTTYRLAKQCSPSGRVLEQTRVADCSIRLERGTQSQVLVTMQGYLAPGARDFTLGNDASPRLLFAGDLDRDGRLDLILDVSDHYNISRPTLFLSSEAEGAAMVGKAAVFESVGC